MARCAACGSTIVFRGSTIANLRFRNADRAARGRIVLAARSVPESGARLLAAKIHAGACPKWSGAGPVDIRRACRVWSALLFARGVALTGIACRRRAIRQQALSATGRAVLGWWGSPWGRVMTPVQRARSRVGLARPHPPHAPSDDLCSAPRMLAAARVEGS